MCAERLRYRALAHALWTLRGPVPGERPVSERGILYSSLPRRGIAPRYDVYAPERPSGTSAVLVHGGGFVLGSRDMKPMRRIASELSASGITVCSIDYRMMFRGGRLEESVRDVREALRHWRAGAPKRGLDASRVAMIGLSAGATLALLAAAEEASVHRLVSCFGLYELDHLHGPLAAVLPRLLFRTADRNVWAERSPRGAQQPSAPTLLLHGTADGLVPHGQAERLAAFRQQRGLPTELVLYRDAPHGFFNEATDVATQAIVAIRDFVMRP